MADNDPALLYEDAGGHLTDHRSAPHMQRNIERELRYRK